MGSVQVRKSLVKYQERKFPFSYPKVVLNVSGYGDNCNVSTSPSNVYVDSTVRYVFGVGIALEDNDQILCITTTLVLVSEPPKASSQYQHIDILGAIWILLTFLPIFVLRKCTSQASLGRQLRPEGLQPCAFSVESTSNDKMVRMNRDEGKNMVNRL